MKITAYLILSVFLVSLARFSFHCPFTLHSSTRHHRHIIIRIIELNAGRSYEQLHILSLVSVFRFAIPHLLLALRWQVGHYFDIHP